MRRLLILLITLMLVSCQVAPGLTMTSAATTATGRDFAPLPDGWQVRLHPGENLYVGDSVSFEVFSTHHSTAETRSVEVLLAGDPRTPIGNAPFNGFGIANRTQATLTWVWETGALSAGDYDIVFNVQPSGPAFTRTLTLLSADDLPFPETDSHWSETRSDCCIVHYLTQTESDRDMPSLLSMLDSQASRAAWNMNVESSQPITVTLVPRFLGHGGFADDTIHVSYLDRSLAGSLIEMVIHHEIVHVLDFRLGGDLRPSILVEGLAVYQSGGHFKTEPIMLRAAALLPTFGQPSRPGLNNYIPLRELSDRFYMSQHEIGYLQAGALVEYMIKRWGWEAYNAFYRDIHPIENAGQAAAIDIALQRHFMLTLDELEQDFLAALRAQPADDYWLEDVRLTIHHFDTLRRYQKLLDPAGYFLTAWLVDEKEMRLRAITADYLRRPDSPLNVTVELLLVAASHSLNSGRLEQVDDLLDSVNAVLDAVEQEAVSPVAADPLAFDVYERVVWLTYRGLTPQTLEVDQHWLIFGVREDSAVLKLVNLPRLP